MNPLDDTILLSLLINNGDVVHNNESDFIEFKSVFHWDVKESRAKYSKSFAAFSNNKGGYLFFGIDDVSKKILGVNDFDKIDSASISDHLNNYFSPAIIFHKRSINVSNKAIGVIYIEKQKDIPTICTKAYDTILRDGALFYRYSGKSDFINGTDMIHLLHQLKGDNSKELVDLKKLEMRQDSLPIFQWSNGHSNQHNFEMQLLNIGKRGKIINVQFTQGKYNVLSDNNKTIEPGGKILIQAANYDGVPSSMAPYELEIQYSDFIGNKYSMVGKGKGGHAIFSDPIHIQ